MLSPDVLRKIRHIQIRTRKAVNDALAGGYVSAFKGRGMEFAEVREYSPGDDVRFLDWNVSARFGQPYVKQFTEERQLSITLVVDVSFSGQFGTTERFKSEIAAELAALLAYSAVKHNDHVGLLLFSDEIERYIRPQKGRGHVFRVISEVLSHRPQGRRTNISGALAYLARVNRKRGVVVLISDFYSDPFFKELRIAAKRHDVIALCVRDPKEYELPRIGLLELSDAETGEQLLIDTSDKAFHAAYREAATQNLRRLASDLRASGVDFVEINAGQSYIDPLARFFRERERRRS